MKMNKKDGILIICAAILVLVFIGTASAKTWYVDDDLQDFPNADFTKIQDAVNIALPGDTVIVYNGTYIENIKVDKGLTIRSENGMDTAIVRAAKNGDHVFEVTANYVNISGFTMEGAKSGSAGISLHDTDYCNISDNNCSNNHEGIHLGHSNNNSISNNNCLNNGENGIYLGDSYNNVIYLNNFINKNDNADSCNSHNIWNLKLYYFHAKHPLIYNLLCFLSSLYKYNIRTIL